MKKKASKKSKKKKPAVLKKVIKKVVVQGVNPAKIKALENELRDIINWLAVFEEEQDLPFGATAPIREKLYGFANRLGRL